MRQPPTPLLRPAATARILWRDTFAQLPVRPSGVPVAHAEGLDADRVLIVGNGLAVGWGVRIHDLALTGTLARALSAATGRGSEVHAAADPALVVATAADALDAVDPAAFDAVVLVVGASDAARLLSEGRWTAGLRAAFDTLLAAGAPPVFVLGIPPVSGVPFFGVRPGGALDQWAEHLNSLTAELCRTHPLAPVYVEPSAEVPLDEGGRDPEQGLDRDRYRGPEEYGRVATDLVAAMAPVLDLAAARGDHPASTAQPVERRLAALGSLGLLDTAPEERFDRLVRMAQKVFGTESAAFTLLDRDRQWHKSRVGYDRAEDPIDDSFCATAILDTGPLVVEDALFDPRPLPRTNVRFYVGHPVEAPDGTRVGTICVFDRAPQQVSEVQVSFLRELALGLQDELAGSVASVTAAEELVPVR